jgi:hypothetical protein
MKYFRNTKKFISNNILYFIFSFYFLYMFGFYFFSEYMPSYNDLSNKLEMGYILGGDSMRYIRGANQIINFEMPEGKGTSYLGYTLFISFFQYFKLNLTFVVLSQIFLTLISSLCIYKISKKLSSRPAAIFVLSLYLFYFPLQIWNFYILTETFFICSVIFILYFFIFFKKKYIPLLIFFMIFYIILRPHGFILIPSLALSLLIWLYLQNKLRLFYSLIICLVILFFPILTLLNFYIENEGIVNTVAEKGIIWGYEDKNNFLEFKANTNGDNNLISLLIFFKNNFYTFTIAFFKKISFFYLRTRPYFSDFHNYYIITFNLIYWPAAIFGLLKMNNKNNIGIILMYCLIIFFTLAVGFSWADWDGRFSLYILPIIFIFAGVGLNNIINFKRYNLKKYNDFNSN